MHLLKSNLSSKETITAKILVWSLFPIIVYLSQLNHWYLHINNPVSKVVNKLPIILTLIWLCFALFLKIKSRKFNLLAYALIPIILFYFVVMDKTLVLNGHPDKKVIFEDPSTYLFMIIIAFFFGRKKHLINRTFENLFMISVVFGISLYVSSFFIVSNSHPYMANALNFMIVIHSLIQTDLGKLVFFDLYSQYGGYSIFFKPIFLFIEPSVVNISIMFAILNFICCIGVFLIIRRLISGHKIQLVTFVACIYLQYYSFTIWPAEKYFQVYPIRMFWPIITTLVVIYTIRTNIHKRIIYFSICSVLAIYWNIETGLAVILALIFLQFFLSMNTRIFIKNLLLYTFYLFSLFTIFICIIYLISKKTFEPELFTRSLRLYPTGALLLLNKIWVIVLFIYGCVSILSLQSKIDKSQEKWFISWLSIGLLMYHLLRTGQHEATLSNVFWPFAICLAIIYEYLLQIKIKGDEISKKHINYDKNWSQLTLKENFWKIFNANQIVHLIKPSFMSRILILIFLSLQVVFFVRIQEGTVVSNEERIWELDDKFSTKSLYNYIDSDNKNVFISVQDQLNGFKSPWQRRIDYAKELSKGHIRKDLLILSDYDSLLYKYANAISPVSWANWRHAYFDWEFEEAINRLSSGEIRYVLIDIYPGTNMEPFSIHGTGLDEKVLEVVNRNFQLIESKAAGPIYSGLTDYGWYPSRLELYKHKN